MLIFARRQLICMALLLAIALPALAQSLTPQTSPFPWWKSEPFKKELALSADQSGRIDKIWETTRPELRAEWDELSKLEEKLSHLIQKDADEALLSRQIDRVEGARANANKTRSVMLVQMLKVLTPDQRVRFKTLHDRWQNDAHKRGPEGGRSEGGRSDGGRSDGRSDSGKTDPGRRQGSGQRQPQ
jgi:Spy/CpxP family protein refolding chaperone